MKENTTYILIKSDGLYVITDMPEEPGTGVKRFFEKHKPYNELLQSAKNSTIRVKNDDYAKKLIRHHLYNKRKELNFTEIESLELINNSIYPLQGYKFEVTNMLQVRHGTYWHDLPSQKEGRCTEGIYRTIQLAIISPIEVKPVEERKQKQTANKIVLAYVSMNWNHEYAENGIISREDAVKAMEEYASIVTEELNKEIDDLKAKIKALRKDLIDACDETDAEIKNTKVAVSELLAVMHGDGGHYESKHGTVKSLQDALELLHTKWLTNGALNDINNALDKIKKLEEQLKAAEHWIKEAKKYIANEIDSSLKI